MGGTMSVEAREATSDAWTRWQGHIINGVFPLGRLLGCSDHSGVFLTIAGGRHAAEVAIKLVPTTRALAESLLPRWKRAGTLAHPHLMRLLEWGGCQLEGLPYLYLVMEYADQTLAQLLLHRALTRDEAREMLPPMLEALAFLHARTLVQGRLKPANILVVGDQLKLASDTIRYAQEGTLSPHARSVYDPPEAQHGVGSTSSDVWGLGASVFAALTRRAPSVGGEYRDAVLLPDDFPPDFRDLVTRCLSSRPKDRPRIPELLAWVSAPPAGAAAALASQPPSLVKAEPPMPEPSTPELRATQPTEPRAAQPGAAEPSTVQPGAVEPSSALRPAPSRPHPMKLQPSHALIIAVGAILALGLAGVHALRHHHTTPSAPAQSLPASGESTAGGFQGAPPPQVRAPVAAVAAARAGGRDLPPALPTAPSALHEVIPEVPSSARRTIRGHIKVWVRLIVEQDGSVFAAATDRAGPSRYFLRLATEAAKKWTFPSVTGPSRRFVQVRFDFSRDGTTARAVTLE